MAFPLLKTRSLFILSLKLTSSIRPNRCTPEKSNPTRSIAFLGPSSDSQNIINFDSIHMTQSVVTNEIQLYRSSRNNVTEMEFSDTAKNYGPPLAVIFPWMYLDETLLKTIIEFYCEKGFDALTVRLTTQQLLYPCVAGNAMNVVTELLKYLNEVHKHRPYFFHGFSLGVYIFGEILAQMTEQYETYRSISNNFKGCLWDSPVDFLYVKDKIGKLLYPKNFFKRSRCNRDVKRHFENHYYDSVVYWLRSRDNFCNPLIKVPNAFFLSYTDVLSNPDALQVALETLKCNGVPVFQKTWWYSEHARHFEKYCYEYMHGMILFFNLSNLFPDESGKYGSSSPSASLTNLRLRKAARDSLCDFVD